MMLESLDKRDQEVAQGSELSERENQSDQSYRSNQGAQSQGSELSEVAQSRFDTTDAQIERPYRGLPVGGAVEGVGGTQAGTGLPTKSMGVVDWAKVIDGYRQSQQAEAAPKSEPSELSERSESSEGAVTQESVGGDGTETQSRSTTTDAQVERPYSGLDVAGTEAQSGGAGVSQEPTANSQEPTAKSQEPEETGGGSVSLEPTDAVEVARERKARAVERVVEGLRDDTFYNALMRGVEDPRELQRKREEYRRKGAAWRSMVSLADMVANAIDAYGADRNAYTLERGLGTARYDQMLARELSRLDSEYRLAEGLERDALGKMQDRKDRASAVELQDARDDLAGAKADRAERARRAREEEEKKYRADRDKVHDNQWEKEQKYRADRDKVHDNQWEKEFNERKQDRQARRASQARGGGSGGGGGRSGSHGGSSGGGRSVMFDTYGKNTWRHQLWVPAGREKEFRESAIKFGRSNAGWLIKRNPVYVRTYAAQMGLPTKGVSTSDLLQRVKESGNMDDMYAGLATTSRGFLLSRCVLYGDGECLSRVMEETGSGIRRQVLRGLSAKDSATLARNVAKSIKADAEVCGVSKGEMYQVYESEMYAGVGENAVGRVDQFMDHVAELLGK